MNEHVNRKRRKRKVIELLKKVNKKHLQKIDKFLQNSPFFPGDQGLLLFNILKEHHPTFKTYNNTLAKNKIFSNPEFDNSEDALTEIFNRLYKKVIEVIVINKVLNSSKLKNQILLEFYKENRLDKPLENETWKKIKELENQPLDDAQSYLEKSQLYDDLYFHLLRDKFKAEKKIPATAKNKKNEITYTTTISQAVHNLELGFIYKLLRYATETYQRSKIFNKETIEILLLEETLKTVEQNNFFANPILQIYYSLITHAQQKESQLTTSELIQLFSDNAALLSPYERRELLQFILNHVTYLGRKNEITSSLDFQLQLYKIGKKEKCFVVNNGVHEIFFTNAILIFCQNNDFTSAKEIILDYGNFLPSEEKDEILRFCNATIYFYQNKYQEAVNLFSQRKKFTQLYLDHRARTLLICSQFELFILGKLKIINKKTPFEIMYNALDSFEKYYLRKDILAKNKSKHYLNFIRTLRKIMELKPMSKNSRVIGKKNLIISFDSHSSIAAKAWLLKHIHQL